MPTVDSSAPMTSSSAYPSRRNALSSRIHVEQTSPLRNLVQLRDADVLFGRGAYISQRTANQNYLGVLAEHAQEYRELKKLSEKDEFLKKMKDVLHNAYPSMRFLTHGGISDSGESLFAIADDEKIREKIRSALCGLTYERKKSIEQSVPALPAAKRLKTNNMSEPQLNGNAVSSSRSRKDLLACVIGLDKANNFIICDLPITIDLIITNHVTNLFKKILVDMARSDFRNNNSSALGGGSVSSKAPMATKENMLAVMNDDKRIRNLRLFNLVRGHVFAQFFLSHQQFIRKAYFTKSDENLPHELHELHELIEAAIEALELPNEFLQALAS